MFIYDKTMMYTALESKCFILDKVGLIARREHARGEGKLPTSVNNVKLVPFVHPLHYPRVLRAFVILTCGMTRRH